MKLLLSFLGAVLELVITLVWFPVHLRNYLQAQAQAAQAQAQAARANDLAANAQTMMILWNLGSDTKPLARLIAERIHRYYGVMPSSVAPGKLVPIPNLAEEER